MKMQIFTKLDKEVDIHILSSEKQSTRIHLQGQQSEVDSQVPPPRLGIGTQAAGVVLVALVVVTGGAGGFVGLALVGLGVGLVVVPRLFLLDLPLLAYLFAFEH